MAFVALIAAVSVQTKKRKGTVKKKEKKKRLAWRPSAMMLSSREAEMVWVSAALLESSVVEVQTCCCRGLTLVEVG
jgi:hypothetical protein